MRETLEISQFYGRFIGERHEIYKANGYRKSLMPQRKIAAQGFCFYLCIIPSAGLDQTLIERVIFRTGEGVMEYSILPCLTIIAEND